MVISKMTKKKNHFFGPEEKFHDFLLQNLHILAHCALTITLMLYYPIFILYAKRLKD